MISLLELQREFVAGLFADPPLCAPGWVVANGIGAARRLQIYRNNLSIGFTQALQDLFPAVRRLSGEDWFSQTAREYQRRHPSPSGDLHHIGSAFAEHLQCTLGGGEFEYFADVARLEWAYQECSVAAEPAPAELAGLDQVTPEDTGRIQFKINPTARLIVSRYPLLTLWNLNRTESGENFAPIDLRSGGVQLLVLRRADAVAVRELPLQAAALLQAFASGATVRSALETVAAIHGDFDVSAALGRLIGLNALVGFEMYNDTSGTDHVA